MLELVDLGYKRDALVTSLSRGMTQRLGLARVLAARSAGAFARRTGQRARSSRPIEIRGLLKELRNMGKTIMVSSHILPELADICNKIGIIERGELLVNAEVAEVMRRVRQQTVLKIGVDRLDEAARLLEQQNRRQRACHSAEKQLSVTLNRPTPTTAPCRRCWSRPATG